MTEEELVQAILEGNRDQFDELIRRIQPRLYNLAVRMVWHPADAEDATQEILIKIITNLSNFRGESAFNTWYWQIAVNYLLSYRTRRHNQQNLSFEALGEDLGQAISPTTRDTETEVERRLLIEEAKVGCMQAMLLCLNPNERAAYILGEIFGITDQQGAVVFNISAMAYRKRLSRARVSIQTFMHQHCGLANPNNPCRCQGRVNRAIERQLIDPQHLLFAQEGDNEALLQNIAQLDEVQRAGALFRTHPEYRSPELLSNFLNSMQFSTLLNQFGHTLK